MRNFFVLISLVFSLGLHAQSKYFPLHHYPEFVKAKKELNHLHTQFLENRIIQNTLPFFMTNYAKDTIWGYYVVKPPLKLQNNSFGIIVNESGEINNSNMTPDDVDELEFYLHSDTVRFKSLKLKKSYWSMIKKGNTEKLLTKNLSDKVRDNSYSFKLANTIIKDRVSLYRVYWDSKCESYTSFILYRNQLMLYSYEYFLKKGFISKEVSKEAFEAKDPIDWVTAFNTILANYYEAK